MTQSFTKEDLSFLIPAMERRFAPRVRALAEGGGSTVGSDDKVPPGPMSVPQPVTVDQQGTMSKDDYNACSMVMAVCQNMVQKSLTDAAKVAGVEAGDALKSMNAWLQAYMDFPFPFFNFKDTQSDVYHKNDWSLNADPDVVENIVNIKNVAGLKDAVIGALRKSGGELAHYENTDRKFNYFGIITGYNETEIAVRIIKFAMNLKTTVVKTMCGSSGTTTLDTSYDTYQFVADKQLMIKIQAKMGDQQVDYFAQKLLAFVQSFYDRELAAYQQSLADSLRG